MRKGVNMATDESFALPNWYINIISGSRLQIKFLYIF